MASWPDAWRSAEARRKTRKRIAIIVLSVVALAAIVAVAAVAASHASSDTSSPAAGDTFSTSLKAVCNSTLYPASCYSTLSRKANSSAPIDPAKLFHFAVRVAMDELSTARQHLGKLSAAAGVRTGNASLSAFESCSEFLGLAVDRLNDTAASAGDLAGGGEPLIEDLRTWLSSAMTYVDTCMDDFETAPAEFKARLGAYLGNSTEFTSNALAIVTQVADVLRSVNLRRRRLMEYGDGDGQLPPWLPSVDRRLLRDVDPRKTASIVVARDGSGKYRSIGAALRAVPEKSKKRVVIYVKKGVYEENVRVEKTAWNVMIVGDGKDETIVSGRRNVVDGTPTSMTATFAVLGQGFIARDIGFRNTAGAAKQQAVALMSDSDKSVFYRCRFDGFQDTLYAHSLRQFYRECDIYGSVDFIFGNAAVVLQSCKIRPRVPVPGQPDTITAQGRNDPNQNTGISIHECSVLPWGNLSSVVVYLGRPWKPYSTTVFMRSSLPGVISPAGWMPWVGNTAPSTIFYGEYRNTGPGAATKNRVKWRGLRTKLSRQVADKFTAGKFIGGSSWIPAAGVKYKPGL